MWRMMEWVYDEGEVMCMLSRCILQWERVEGMRREFEGGGPIVPMGW